MGVFVNNIIRRRDRGRVCFLRLFRYRVDRINNDDLRFRSRSHTTSRMSYTTDFNRSSQTLPRNIHSEKYYYKQQHSPPTKLPRDAQETINVSIINTVSSSRPVVNGGPPIKPARSYKSSLMRSKSFNFNDENDYDAVKTVSFKNNSSDYRTSAFHTTPRPQRLDENPSGLKSPGIVSSLTRTKSQQNLRSSSPISPTLPSPPIIKKTSPLFSTKSPISSPTSMFSSTRVMSPTHRVVSPTARVASPTTRAVSPTTRVGSPTTRVVSPTARMASPTPRLSPSPFNPTGRMSPNSIIHRVSPTTLAPVSPVPNDKNRIERIETWVEHRLEPRTEHRVETHRRVESPSGDQSGVYKTR